MCATYLLASASVLPLVRREAWWIRLFDFPRPQIAIGLVAAGAALAFSRKRGSALDLAALGIGSAAAAYQMWEMARYTPLRSVLSQDAKSSDPARRLRLLTANVLQSNRSYAEYIDLIAEADPDVVVLAETDAAWERHLRGLERAYPYRLQYPQANTYGLLLYSRLPLEDSRIRFRVEEDVPSFDTKVRLRTGDQCLLYVLHPRPPRIGTGSDLRDEELIRVAEEVKDAPLPVIVTGDLNDVAWSHTTRLFLRISRMLDPRVGRAFLNTFHAHYPPFRWPLDHLFHSRAFRLVRFRRGPKTESDHFPVIVDLSYEPEIRDEQERPKADQDDHAEARRKLEQTGS